MVAEEMNKVWADTFGVAISKSPAYLPSPGVGEYYIGFCRGRTFHAAQPSAVAHMVASHFGFPDFDSDAWISYYRMEWQLQDCDGGNQP